MPDPTQESGPAAGLPLRQRERPLKAQLPDRTGVPIVTVGSGILLVVGLIFYFLGAQGTPSDQPADLLEAVTGLVVAAVGLLGLMVVAVASSVVHTLQANLQETRDR